jgi:hypothetical protein
MISTLLAKESPVLRLDVYVVEQAAEIHSFVTNVSGTAITIPTTTDGTEAMSWSITGGPRSTFGFSIGAHEIGKLKVIPSPYRLSPVTLQPGESAELPLIRSNTYRDGAKTVKITYSVDKSYAERFGWWSGCVSTTAVIGEGDNPYVVRLKPTMIPPNHAPHPTALAVTPRACARVAPARLIAGW